MHQSGNKVLPVAKRRLLGLTTVAKGSILCHIPLPGGVG